MTSEIAFSHYYLVEPEKILTNEVVREGFSNCSIIAGMGASIHVHLSRWWTLNGYLTIH